MSVSLGQVRERLARRSRGELSPSEESELIRDARVLRRRVERLQALHPDLGVSLAPELEALAGGHALAASN